MKKKKHFADFWDAMSRKHHKHSARRAEKVMICVGRHHPGARRILELGVGSGNVLARIPATLERWGIDVDPAYVALAKKRVPKAKLSAASMHRFSLPQRFDVIYSIFDSINFLPSFAHWQKTFANVEAHLADEGIFVFDMYAEKKLTDMAKEAGLGLAYFEDQPFGYSVQRRIVRDNRLTWDLHVFERATLGRFDHHRFLFKERVWPVAQVEDAVTKHFTILEKLDGDTMGAVGPGTTRIHYVVRRHASSPGTRRTKETR